MNRGQFMTSIRSAFQALIEVGLTGYDRLTSYERIEPSNEFRRIALQDGARYEDVYRAGLKQRLFNFILEDNSYFQFWHDHRPSPRKLRYAYYPNPFVTPDIVSLSPTDWYTGDALELYYQAMEEATIEIRVPSIRYDLALDEHKPAEHPASHLTIGANCENRWPICRVLTPRLFTLLVCRHFYPDAWANHVLPAPTPDGFVNAFDKKLAQEKSASPTLSAEYFTDLERKLTFID